MIAELDYSVELGIEYYFLANTGDDMEIIELEGVVFQLDMLNNFSPELQEKMLFDILNDDSGTAEEVSHLLEIWKEGSLEQLETILFSDNAQTTDDPDLYDEYMQKMITDRNIGMADRIETYLADETGAVYFVVAGAGHFITDIGIIELLQTRGYTVERIR